MGSSTSPTCRVQSTPSNRGGDARGVGAGRPVWRTLTRPLPTQLRQRPRTKRGAHAGPFTGNWIGSRSLDGSALVFPNAVGTRDFRWAKKTFLAACPPPRSTISASVTSGTFASRLAMVRRAYLEAEQRRLLYVAATRARDLLVVSRPANADRRGRPWQMLEPFLATAPAVAVPPVAVPPAPTLPDLSAAGRVSAIPVPRLRETSATTGATVGRA